MTYLIRRVFRRAFQRYQKVKNGKKSGYGFFPCDGRSVLGLSEVYNNLFVGWKLEWDQRRASA